MATTTAPRAAVSRASKAPMKAFAVEEAQQDGPHSSTPLVSDGNKAAPACTMDRYSHPLVVPSDTAFKALLITPLVVWWVAVLAGAWVYEGLPKGQKVYHVMVWFDRGILRPAGPLVPFVVLLFRALVHFIDHRRQQGGSVAAPKQRQQLGLRLGSLVVNCLTVYSALAVARLAIYLTHYFLLSQRLLEFHIVSDHIFLAATMLISLHTEVVCLMSDLLRVETRLADQPAEQEASLTLSEVLLTLLLVLALFLYLFTAADMYFTAKYYHFPLESVATTVLVFILFQCPMLVWMVRRRQRSLGHHKG